MGCKRYNGCIICVLLQISWQLQTQIVKNRILSVSLLGNKLYQIVIHLVKNQWILEPPRQRYDEFKLVR